MFETIAKIYTEMFKEEKAYGYGFFNTTLQNGELTYSADDSVYITQNNGMHAKIGGKSFEIRLKLNDNIENGFYFETLDSEIQFRVYKNVEGFILLKIQTIYKIKTFLCALLPICDYGFFFDKNVILGDETIELLKERDISIYTNKNDQILLVFKEDNLEFIKKSFKGLGWSGQTNLKLFPPGYELIQLKSNELKSKDI
jgi:hypothetical protein